ncbi:MAG: LytTR family transcriptional regulator [Candidatus Azobacteroides sp.]|nr:LytTR family transcriptional regulator [Candidatus Azobacteroides sp.]
MNNPFLQSNAFRFLYAVIWVALIVTQIFLLHYLTDAPLLYIFCDSFICNILQAICMLALWYPAAYYRNAINIPLFLLFHLSLAILSFSIWLGAGFLLTTIFLPPDWAYSSFFLHLLPVRIFFGILIYVLFILIYYLSISLSEIKGKKERIKEMEASASTASVEKLTRISVKKKQEIHFISVNQIHYIEANGDYVLIHTADNKYLKDRTMKYWETHLPSDLFVRIHRSFIVNVEHISRIELYEKEMYKVLLKNGNSLKASIAGYKQLKQKMLL